MSDEQRVKLYTVSEAARLLGVHRNTLRRWAESGKVPHVRLPSGFHRWTPEQIEHIRREMGLGDLEGKAAA